MRARRTTRRLRRLPWVLPQSHSAILLIMAGFLVGACGSSGDGPTDANGPTIQMVIAWGDDQVRFPSTDLPTSLAVQIRDLSGVSVPNVTVSWTVVSGDGAVSPASSVTDGFGRAETVWTLGPQEGAHTVAATAGASATVTFAARAVQPGPIAYYSTLGCQLGRGQIWVMGVDGSDKALVTTTCNALLGGGIDWSPDGRRLAFVQEAKNGDPQIFVVNVDGTGERQLTSVTSSGRFSRDVNHPDWSPDGTRIAFAVKRGAPAGCADPQFNVFTMDTTGTTLEQLTAGCEQANQLPDWSPDGSQMLLSSETEGVVVRDADGSNRTRLMSNAWFGKWSADGQKVVLVVPRGDDWSIWTVNADGSGATPVYEGIFPEHPDWSPDGTRVVFSDGPTGVGEAADVLLLELATGTITKLTRTSGAVECCTAWRR